MQASKNNKLGWLPFEESALFGNFAATKQTSLPKHGQRYTFSRTADTKSATKLLQQAKILQISRESGGERYVKTFNAWCHLTVMLYAVIMRFDSA